MVNNDSAFLYTYAYDTYVGIGIRYIGGGSISNRAYRVIVRYET